ncbi:hypothetical protein H257_15861 [Aphanomyces astaci]|uniref:Uncharacterized protein n=1 Tax=Aphanomyces astaci TaxID=112090 RepID=W4FKV5_APHAT|nr:hypothetical protein H257_15861 [Aphanomyces astaci]ETV68127.1 hypothetical protein H257_15861 [Aphanomyces astaci]|eukprot:XP_009842426.1 hypothetical protein H257_15861 [Aphanomyces astaci]
MHKPMPRTELHPTACTTLAVVQYTYTRDATQHVTSTNDRRKCAFQFSGMCVHRDCTVRPRRRVGSHRQNNSPTRTYATPMAVARPANCWMSCVEPRYTCRRDSKAMAPNMTFLMRRTSSLLAGLTDMPLSTERGAGVPTSKPHRCSTNALWGSCWIH